MTKLKIMLKSLLEISTLDNFIIDAGALYMITHDKPTINAHFDAEGNLEYAEVFNTLGEDICDISDIRQIWYAQNTVTIITDDYKITLSSSGCSMTML